MKSKSTNKRNKGIVLVLVITTIGLVGVVMFFLSGASNTMMFQATESYLQACERNLTISGLNWAKVNTGNENFTDFNNPIELDVNDLNFLNSSLQLKIKPTDRKNEIQINSSCSRARQIQNNQRTFILSDLK